MKLLSSVAAATILSGCALNPTMNPNQILESDKVKNATAWCINFVGPAGTLKAAGANLDKGVIPNGGLVVDPNNTNCIITIDNETRPPAAK